jgi:RNA polymerase sigma-70 factor (ECF subfamily)
MTDEPDLDEVLRLALDRARGGDQDGFVELFRGLQPTLVRYLRSLDPGRADDVASETWLQAVRDLDGFTGDVRAFRSWLFTVARNRLIDAQRYDARRPVSPAADPHELVGDVPGGLDPADAVVEGHGTEAALALVRTLPPDQAEAVMLRVVAGLDVADVARIMDRSSGAVRVLCHRGLTTLSRLLAGSSRPDGPAPL